MLLLLLIALGVASALAWWCALVSLLRGRRLLVCALFAAFASAITGYYCFWLEVLRQ